MREYLPHLRMHALCWWQTAKRKLLPPHMRILTNGRSSDTKRRTSTCHSFPAHRGKTTPTKKHGGHDFATCAKAHYGPHRHTARAGCTKHVQRSARARSHVAPYAAKTCCTSATAKCTRTAAPSSKKSANARRRKFF